MTLKPCPRCNKSRVIKLGLTQQRVPKQKYYCHKCRQTFTGIYDGSAFITNSSNVTEEELENDNNPI